MSENCWVYNEETHTLDCKESPEYYVSLDECTTSAQVLDWIMQVTSKTWATDKILADLLRALVDLIHPQATLCSGGEELGPINTRAAVKNVSDLREVVKEILGPFKLARIDPVNTEVKTP